MLMSVFALYDSAISTWMPPLFAKNKGEIVRWFMDAVNNPDSKIAKYPSDFTLFELGTWDDDKCKFDLLKTPDRIGVAMEYLRADLTKIAASVDERLESARQIAQKVSS